MKKHDPIKALTSKSSSASVEKEIRDQAKQTAKSGACLSQHFDTFVLCPDSLVSYSV